MMPECDVDADVDEAMPESSPNGTLNVGEMWKFPFSDPHMPRSTIVYDTGVSDEVKEEENHNNDDRNNDDGDEEEVIQHTKSDTFPLFRGMTVNWAASRRSRVPGPLDSERFDTFDVCVQVILLLIHKYILNGSEFQLSAAHVYDSWRG